MKYLVALTALLALTTLAYAADEKKQAAPAVDSKI
jgi:hypothetical protein